MITGTEEGESATLQLIRWVGCLVWVWVRLTWPGLQAHLLIISPVQYIKSFHFNSAQSVVSVWAPEVLSFPPRNKLALNRIHLQKVNYVYLESQAAYLLCDLSHLLATQDHKPSLLHFMLALQLSLKTGRSASWNPLTGLQVSHWGRSVTVWGWPSRSPLAGPGRQRINSERLDGREVEKLVLASSI